MNIKGLLSATMVLGLSFTGFSQSQQIKDAMKMTDNEQFEKATSVFKTVMTKDPENAEVYFYMGQNLLGAEKIDTAQVVFKKGIELNSKMPLNHIGLSTTYRLKGKLAEAKSSMDAAFALLTEKGVKIKDEMKVRMYVEAAKSLIEGNSPDANKALEYISKAMEIDEVNVAAYITKGDALFVKDNLNATDPLTAYKKAAELDRSSAKAVARIAFMYYRAKQWQKSYDYYNEALKIDANFAPAYSGRGDASYYLNKLEDGIKDYQKYLDLNKGNISARKRYAGFLFVAKKFDECMAEINSIEKVIGTEDLMLNRLKAYCLYEKGDYANALKAMEYYMSKQSAEKVDATDNEYMGRIQWKLGNDADRDKYLMKAIDMDPKNKISIAAEIIAALKEKKDNKGQIFWYKKKVYAWGSKDANDWYYMGICAYNADMCGVCDTAFTEYVKVMPDYALGYYYIAWAKDCQDKAEPKQWTAKPFYETFLSKIKPEEEAKMNKKISEAYYYFARFHYLTESKNYGMTKCYAEKIIAMNASEAWVKSATDLSNLKEVKAATAATECK